MPHYHAPNTKEELEKLDQIAMEASEAGFNGEVVKRNRWAHRTLGLVLAGGRSSRMGGADKARLQLQDKTLLQLAEARLAPQVSGLIVSSNCETPSDLNSKSPIVADDITGHVGPLGGILTAMRWAQKNASNAFWITSVAVDTPFFPQDLVDRFIMAMGGPEPCIVLAQSGERTHPVFGLWPICLADSLEQYLKAGDRKVHMWAEQHLNSRAIFRGPILEDEIEIDPFFNINEPDDLAIAKVIAQELTILEGEKSSDSPAKLSSDQDDG